MPQQWIEEIDDGRYVFTDGSGVCESCGTRLVYTFSCGRLVPEPHRCRGSARFSERLEYADYLSDPEKYFEQSPEENGYQDLDRYSLDR